MSQTTDNVSWERQGRLPVISGNGRQEISEGEAQMAEEVMESAGAVLFRGFDLPVDDFRALTKRLGSSYSAEKWAPDVMEPKGPRIGLHTEQAFLPSVPSAIWFYMVQPAENGGATVLCDGAAIASGLSSDTRRFLEETDVLYWRRFSGQPPSKPYVRRLNDPPGLERNYREGEVSVHDDHYETTTLCSPLIRSRVGRRQVFGNHILNTVKHPGWKTPPVIDGFHQSRLPTKELLPQELIEELRRVTSPLLMKIQLREKDFLWLDNTRILHGRDAFEGARQVLVLKAFYADQWASGFGPTARGSATAPSLPAPSLPAAAG